MSENEFTSENQATLRHLFGDNRAEWPPESFNDLFVAPAYLEKLESFRPSFLIGGRGTGKTTSLQSLRFIETYERLESRGLSYSDQEYLGVLVRMNKNRVHAFQGETISEDLWNKSFAHYFNMLVCSELTNLAIWLESKSEIKLSIDQINTISLDMGFKNVNSLDELQHAIKRAISELQLYVNNPTINSNVVFSMAEAPIRTFVETMEMSRLTGGRIIFCCIDEYENLLDYQQAIINTYIKHAEPPLSYKVGVRKYGLRNRQTTDANDLLNTPDDFAEIEIVDEGFEYFAKKVANMRLSYARGKLVSVPENLDDFLDDLSISDEAILLGADDVSDVILSDIEANDIQLYEYLKDKPKSDVYMLQYWVEKEGGTLYEYAKSWQKDEKLWQDRLNNHRYASLFWLTKGKKGLRIRKYYSGTRTMLSLSGGNIRYFLELIDSAISHQVSINENKSFTELTLSPKAQTLALKDVGKRRLDQLEGLADHGVQLKRLVLAIGKVFFEFARNPANRTPEVNSFVITGNTEDIERLMPLLIDGVGHLAFEQATRTKNTSNLEIRDDEFRLHRIFSGFFEISYRKKRRTSFKAVDLLEVVEGKPTNAIASLLKDQPISEYDDLPEQMAFFNAFYDGSGDVS